jgi:hypothetical protein
MKNWLLCLFTYNRFVLLQNAVRSIDRFFAPGDRLIIDDGSSDPRVRRLLVDVASRSHWKVKVMDRKAAHNYGGFYRNMNYALGYAVENGYDYCLFFEDDQQLVWKKEDYTEYVENVFATCPDAIQIQPLFARRILDYSQTTEFIRPAMAYRTDRGFNTTAIWNLALVRQHPDYHLLCDRGDDLPSNSAYWLMKHCRVYIQYDPTIAIVPWVSSQSVFYRQSSETGLAEAAELLLNPLTQEEVHFLGTRNPQVAAYQEYFNLSPNNVARPIWHQQGQNLNRFYYLCRRIVELEDSSGQSPRRIPILDQWQPTAIPPVQSHLDWNPSAPAIRGRGDSLGPVWAKRIERLAEFVRFKFRDYIGYRILKNRLRREQHEVQTHNAGARF